LRSGSSSQAGRRLAGIPLLLGLAGGLLACSRGGDAGNKAAPPASAAPSASADEAAPAPSAIEIEDHDNPIFRQEPPAHAPVEDPGPPLPAAEARRTTLRRLAEDRALGPHEAALKEHFGNPISFPLAVQAAPLAGGGRALLFQSGGKDHHPFILVHDAKGQALWIKERPLAGIAPGVTEMALVPAAKGDVLLSWYDPPSKIIAARHWDAHGSILVDFPLLQHADACAALSGLYWRGEGFVVAAATAGAARAQLLSDEGVLSFGGEEGVELPWTSRVDAPVAIAVDGDHGVMFFQAGHAGAGKAGAPPDHLLAARFDAHGKALWAKPLVVGPVAGAATERVLLSAGGDGNIVVPRLAVMVTPGGSVISIPGKR
jgi:hypothetical protein